MSALLVAFGVVFLAEFGDKTELLTLGLAARFGPVPVLAGVTVTTIVMNALSVTIGVGLARAVPARAVTLAAGVAFLGFAVWSGRSAVDGADIAVGASRRTIAVRAAALFAVSEIGDKTMLATIALATRGYAALVWVGATAGVVAAELLAVLVGARAGQRLSHRIIQTGSALVFGGLGVALVVRGAVA